MALSSFLDPIPTSLQGDVPAELARVADTVVRTQDLATADELRFLIDSLVKASGAQQATGEVAQVVALLELLFFDALPQQQALTWIRQHFVTFLADERIDVFQQIRLRLLVIEYGNRGEEKEALRRALASSEQLIGPGQLTIDGQTLPPTVANWITAYRRSSQVPKRTNIDRSQFLFDDTTAKALEESDRHLVADTLYMYDLLGLATDENGALDTPDPALFLDEDEDSDSVEAQYNPLAEFLKEQEALEASQTEVETAGSPPVGALSEAASSSEASSEAASSEIPLPETPLSETPLPDGASSESVGDEVSAADEANEEIVENTVSVGSSDGIESSDGVEFSGGIESSDGAESFSEAGRSQDVAPAGPFRGLTSAVSAKYMTIDGLRAAGSGLLGSLQASTERAQQLAQDPEQKANLLAAFKMTDTYQVYVDMGSESVDAGVALAQVSQEREQMKRPYLSPEEFEAVSQFMRVISL